MAALKERLKVWFQNATGIPARLMAGYLRRRGWVAFYLEPQARQCNGVCWLQCYTQVESHKPENHAKGCQNCGAAEVEAMTPRTVYACGSSDYDHRPGTFRAGKCGTKSGASHEV